MKRILILCCLVLVLSLIFTGAAHAVTGYDLSWWTVDNGGGAITGNGYSLNGTIGQADAGATMSGSAYRLAGGFWAQVAPGGVEHPLFLPLVIR
jgi:hypothetical protein